MNRITLTDKDATGITVILSTGEIVELGQTRHEALQAQPATKISKDALALTLEE